MPINKELFSIGALFKKIIRQEIGEIHTSIPAKIEKVNTNNTVDVIPLIKNKNLDGEYVSLPVISNVPVRFFRNSVALMSIPINKGDNGTLVFAERSIKNWQLSGGIQSPEDDRKFNLTDCYFTVDLMKDGDGISFDANLNIIFNNAKIVIKPTGEINVENSNGHVKIEENGNIEVEGPTIQLGNSAVEKAVLGNTLETLLNIFIGVYNGHTHTSDGTPPTQLATPLAGTELSSKVKVK